MTRRFVYIAMLACCLFFPLSVFAEKMEKTSAEQMHQLVAQWPPTGWQQNPPGATAPYPPYIAAGEFSGTLYRTGTDQQLWSAHISITDQQTHEQAEKLLSNFPFCKVTSHNGYPARSCSSQGESLGRRSLAYAAENFLVEISVIGPLPLTLPELELNLPRGKNTRP